jgi:branched-chain amino acid transport system permease protein
VGGLGTMEGPIVGTVIFVFLQQFLSEYVGFNLVILGAITIIIIVFAPKGIVGTLQARYGLILFPIHRK